MAGVSKETQMSIEASSMFPGFRFSPTDAELISYYLKKKLEGAEKCVEVITEIEICRYEPWDLPGKSVIQSENEWFFFSARGRKYPNGSQSRRATELGYWKATGKERNVKSGSNVIGTKRTLVFHIGRAPKGERTEWIMHEYCMSGQSQDSLVVCRLRKNIEFRLNDTSNPASSRQRNVSTIHTSNSVLSQGGIDQMGASEGDKVAECSKKCSSSYDSHSIEQCDSASESDLKLSNEFTVAESSSHQKDSEDEEDCYADILNDDIIKLDETSLSTAPAILPVPVAASKSETEKKLKQPVQAIPLQANHVQGTAIRRIRLENHRIVALARSFRKSHIEKPENQDSGKPLKCVIGLFSPKTSRYQHMYIFFTLLTVLALLLSLLGGSRQVKRFMYATFYNDRWH